MEEREQTRKFYVHPASLLCKVRGFTVKDVLSASKELQERNYISFTAPEKDWCSGEYSLCMERAGQRAEMATDSK